MATLNKVTIIGHVGRDPEIRMTSSENKTIKTEDFEPARETGCVPAALGLVLLVLIIIIL